MVVVLSSVVVSVVVEEVFSVVKVVVDLVLVGSDNGADDEDGGDDGDEGGGKFNLQNSQGRMKYLGSTRGAVTRERVVETSQTRTKLVLIPPCSFSSDAACSLVWDSVRVSDGGLVALAFIKGIDWLFSVLVPSPVITAQAQPKYTGTARYFASQCLRMIHRKT